MSRTWTPVFHSGDGYSFLRKRSQGVVLTLCIMLLASCGFSSGTDTSDMRNQPPVNTQTADTALPALTSPPGLGERPPAPGTTGTLKTSDGLPALQPLRGVNTTSLFADRITDRDDRLDRLENAVQELRNDFDSMAPAITRLVAVEQDMQDLIVQLENLTLEEPAPRYQPAPAPVIERQLPSAPQAAPPPAPNPTPAQALSTPTPLEPAPAITQAPASQPPKPAAGGNNNVYAMRVGVHPNKTRIVLDVHNNTNYSLDVDNAEKLLIVELPNLKWDAIAQKTYNNTPFLQAHRVDSINDGKGTRLIIQLSDPVSISYQGTMNGDRPGEKKIILDLSAGSV